MEGRQHLEYSISRDRGARRLAFFAIPGAQPLLQLELAMRPPFPYPFFTLFQLAQDGRPANANGTFRLRYLRKSIACNGQVGLA
jgi:hypothetical protein